MQSNKGENLIVDLPFEFSLKIIAYTEELEQMRRYVMANQLLKSGTSIGANVREAQNAESKNDFIHKTKLAAKEADETHYWLERCQQSKTYPSGDELLHSLDCIIRVLSKIIGASKGGNNDKDKEEQNLFDTFKSSSFQFNRLPTSFSNFQIN